ncbi:MAG: type IV pilus assembly protein PilM [Deltaproteobacteria bacterium]|jgi:type IV pilus assembly protein PilM
MLFAKKNHLVGLDIGSKTLKVCEVFETRKKGFILNKLGMITLPNGAIEDGVIKDPETVSEAICELFKVQKIREKNVAISIGGYSVIVKKIQLQNMTDAELQETIQYEAEQYIPFDINDVNLDFHILGESQVAANKLDVILVAAKKELVSEYVNLIELSGLRPCVVDIDAFALQNIYEINYDTKEEVVALIDIGASKTSLNIVKDGVSLFTRDVSLGCNQINLKISNKVVCSLEDAETIKLTGKSNKITPQEIADIVTLVIGDWCLEIRRAIDFFYSTYPDDQIRKILISGGGANIKEFQQILASETASEVEVINPFGNFSIDKRLDPSFLKKVSPQAAICMGLAIRRIDDK